jgi:hypothetical protein
LPNRQVLSPLFRSYFGGYFVEGLYNFIVIASETNPAAFRRGELPNVPVLSVLAPPLPIHASWPSPPHHIQYRQLRFPPKIYLPKAQLLTKKLAVLASFIGLFNEYFLKCFCRKIVERIGLLK